MFGMKFKYFINDCMASSSIGIKMQWERHITNFTKLYNQLYPIKNIIDIGANFGYHTLLFSRECSQNKMCMHLNHNCKILNYWKTM